MKLTIYHNPRCSKSRQTLDIIRENGIEPRIVKYLEAAPAATTIRSLAASLGVGVIELMRTGEEEFKGSADVPAADDDEGLATWLEQHPKVLQRPIVVDDDNGTAVIGRPPENVRKLIES